MNGITFGDYHSNDFSLILASIEDIPPALKENYLEVPYRNALLDMSEAFGKKAYEKRTPRYTFSVVQGGESWDAVIRKIAKAIHGKRLKIIYDRDPAFYLLGRVSVNSFKSDKRIGTVVLDAVCEPFKFKLLPTIETFTVSGTLDITLENEGEPVYPKITTTAEMQVVQGSNSFSYGVVTDYQTKIKLEQGANSLTLNGTGTVTFTYQEGVL